MNQAPLEPAPSPLRPISSRSETFEGDDSTWAIAATQRRHASVFLTPEFDASSMSESDASARDPSEFWPATPQSLADTGLRSTQIESIVLKYLLNMSAATGREIATQVALPFRIVQQSLYGMKESRLVSLKSDAPLGDYCYELTEFGAEHGRRFVEQCTYFGAAPVPLEQYAASVAAQSVNRCTLNMDHIRESFHDMVMSDSALGVIGEALNLGRGMFLHGAPGNGKSSVAERISRVFCQPIWIPRALSVGGDIVRLYDSIHHTQIGDGSTEHLGEQTYDHRWVRIKRPTIVVGGELDLDGFDISSNHVTGINEAPLQLKANCGTLVIDDFGRNRFRPTELLNRLVVPMERALDSFHLKSGRTFQAPFECMLVFASNDVPAEIVDEAFLRRIPFKIAVADPDEQQFRELFGIEAERLDLDVTDELVDYLLQRHYREPGRPLRFCHPRDLLRMIANTCEFHGRPPVVTEQELDRAVEQYIGLETKSQPS